MKKTQLIFGIHAVQALLNQQARQIERLCIKPAHRHSPLLEIMDQARKQGIAIEICSKAQLDHLAHHAAHQGIVAYCTPVKSLSLHELRQQLALLNTPPFLLILDGIQDPHNLGACFRVADAAGVHAIIAPKNRSTGITPAVSKVASGAIETILFIQVANLASTLKQLKEDGIWLYGASEKAQQTLYQTQFNKQPTALIMGQEGQGLRQLTQQHCDYLVRIPMHGHIPSLNIAVAAGILLFEIAKQRLL